MKKQNPSSPSNSLPTKREEWHGKIKSYIDVNLTRSEIYIDLINSTLTGKTPKQNKLTLSNLPKLHSLSDNEKFLLFSTFFSSHDQYTKDIYFDRKNWLITPLWIDYINELLNSSVSFYQGYLLRTIWDSFIQKWNKKKTTPIEISFRDTKDVLDFIEATTLEKNTSSDRQIDCSLLKIAEIFDKVKSYEEKLFEAEKNFKDIINEYFFPYFYDYKWQTIDCDKYEKLLSQQWDWDFLLLQTKSELSNKKPIFFKMSSRTKGIRKIVLKILSNPHYTSLDAIHDLYGMRNETSNKEDALYLKEYLRINIFNRETNKKELDIADKKIFVTDFTKSEEDQIRETIEFISLHKDHLDLWFYNYITWFFSSQLHDLIKTKSDPKGVHNKKKPITNKSYIDIKFRGKLWWEKVEIQTNLINSKNESWFNHHNIRDAVAKISAIVELQTYIPESIIYRYIYEAIEKNINEDTSISRKPELLMLGGYKWDGKVISQKDKQNAAHKIFKYLLEKEKAFVKLRLLEKQHSAIYTTKSNWNSYHPYNTKKKSSPNEFLSEDYKKMYPAGASVEIDWKWTSDTI